ncbi:MAG: aminoacyl-tRNA hydrolase [Candidatus Margulisiibacteriota bacterium]
MYLIVGLGNPGKQYENTRHNIGFKVIEELARRYGAVLRFKSAFNAFVSKADIEGENALLFLPQTYMNNSGQAVSSIMRKYALKPGHLIVIHDEIDLPSATIKIKNGGGAAGHNGLGSIIEHLGSRDFIRIRIGIGRPDKEKLSGAEYVLSPFSKSEKKLFKDAVCYAADAAEAVLLQGTEKAMNSFNKKAG